MKYLKFFSFIILIFLFSLFFSQILQASSFPQDPRLLTPQRFEFYPRPLFKNEDLSFSFDKQENVHSQKDITKQDKEKEVVLSHRFELSPAATLVILMVVIISLAIIGWTIFFFR